MNNKERILDLQNIINKALVPLIDDDYVLLDIPNHCNIGDTLIWEGELQFLKSKVNHQCLYTACIYNWDETKIKNANIILFHGGGNFGDLYRIFQEFRLYVTSKYPYKRIIILPQTVWYNDKSLIEKDCSIFCNHPDIHICVRDKESFDLLKSYIPSSKLLLLPDMAFFMKIDKEERLSNKILFLKRKDAEISTDNLMLPPEITEVADWPTFSNNKYVQTIKNLINEFKIKLSIILQEIPVLSNLVDSRYGLNRRDNKERYIAMAISFFNKFETIYTTRLHGLILGVIMGKKMVIVDNKYNKCLNFYRTWLKDYDDITIINNA